MYHLGTVHSITDIRTDRWQYDFFNQFIPGLRRWLLSDNIFFIFYNLVVKISWPWHVFI